MRDPEQPAAAFPVEVHGAHLSLPADVAAYVQEKLHGKLGKFGSRILAVVVHFKDVNGSRGGVDKACHLEARLAGLDPVNIEERHHDLRAAIDGGIDQLCSAVHRHVERARTLPRVRGRKMVRHSKLTE